MATAVGKLVAKKMLAGEMAKYKTKSVTNRDDPYFTMITLKNGKQKKVKKQIPDFIPAKDAAILAAAKKRAYQLDCALFEFAGIRFGWSSVVGIVPEVGDVIDLLLAYHVYSKCCQIEGGLETKDKAKMGLNMAIDFAIGLVPFLGDVADAAFKCNTKNVALLEKILIERYGKELAEEILKNPIVEPFEEDGTLDELMNNKVPSYEEATRKNTTNPGANKVQIRQAASVPQPASSAPHQKKNDWRKWYAGNKQPDIEAGRA